MLRHHGQHLRMAQQYFTHLTGGLGARIQRHGHGHRGAYPEVALFQCREKLRPEEAHQTADQYEETTAQRDHELAPRQRPAQRGGVHPAQTAHHDGFDFADFVRHCERRQHRCDGESRDQCAGERVAIGAGHGPEDLAFDALHGEQRDERSDGDHHGEQHRPIHLQGADVNQPQPVAPGEMSASTSNSLVVPPQLLMATTPGMVESRRSTTQSWTVRRFVKPKCGGPTIWYR
jgi:hypothetical protein